jgi:acyl carrier protein
MTPHRALARIGMRVIDAVQSHVALAGAARIEAGVRVFGFPDVTCHGELLVGQGAVLVSTPVPIRLVVDPGARLVIGAGSLVERGAMLRAHRSLVVGRNVRVGAGCVIDDQIGDGIVADGTWLEDADRDANANQDDAGALVGAIEERIRSVVGRVVPSASDAEESEDLRLFKEWDSLAALRVLVALEREFRVALPHDLFTREPRLASVTPLILEMATHRGKAR